MIYDYIMGLVGIIMGLGVVPHIIKMQKCKCSDGQSLFSAVIMTIGIGMWAIYGVLHLDYAIIIANIVGFLTGVQYSITIYYYRYVHAYRVHSGEIPK